MSTDQLAKSKIVALLEDLGTAYRRRQTAQAAVADAYRAGTLNADLVADAQVRSGEVEIALRELLIAAGEASR